jgi:hypothetical protein
LGAAQKPAFLATNGVVRGHKPVALNDPPFADKPSHVMSQLLQLSVECLEILLAHQISALDFGPDPANKFEVIVPHSPVERFASSRVP